MSSILSAPVSLALTRGVARRSNIGALQWHGNAGGSVGTRSELVTYGLKIEAEAAFDAVALMWVNYEANAVNNCKAVVAATETFQTDTQAHRYQPFVGGSAHNALRGSSDYGWDAVTWGGAATVNLAAAGGTAAPTIAVSDWMPINSVPRADGGTRPLLLMRVYHDGVGDGSFTYHQEAFNTAYNAASSANRGRLLDVGQALSDAIGTIGTGMTAGIRTALVAPIFRHRYRTVTVANVGDSISEGTGTASSLDNWNRRACYDLSTATAPVVPMNMGYPSQTTTTYLASSKVILAAVRPSIAFYFPYSPNDGITSNRGVQDAMARAADFIDFCHINDIVPILATPVPKNGISVPGESYRQAIKANVLAMGSAGTVIVADFASVTADSSSPQQWLPGLNFDALHPSDAGHEAMSVVAKAAIRKAIRSGR